MSFLYNGRSSKLLPAVYCTLLVYILGAVNIGLVLLQLFLCIIKPKYFICNLFSFLQKYLPVREAAACAICVFIRHNKKVEQRTEMCHRLIQGWLVAFSPHKLLRWFILIFLSLDTF